MTSFLEESPYSQEYLAPVVDASLAASFKKYDRVEKLLAKKEALEKTRAKKLE